jgi:hypothetical protein
VTGASPSDATLWGARAEAAWDALARAAVVRRRGRLVVREPGGLRAVPLWPFSQVLHAAVLVGAAEVPALRGSLESYRRGAAYAERPRTRRHYYDDNAWVGLALLDSGDAATAARVLEFLREGCVTLPEGSVGVRWVEGGDALHACSTGSTGLLALRLADAVVDDAAERAALLALASGCTSFLEELLDADGLVADHRRPDGSVDPAVYTYNQALLVGLLAGSGRIDDALALARRVLAAFDPARLWAHAPAFNAILVRELVRLDALRPAPDLRAWCTTYLDRAWTQARDPASGLLTAGGIGRYDDGVVLDHAALVGAMAVLADVVG